MRAFGRLVLIVAVSMLATAACKRKSSSPSIFRLYCEAGVEDVGEGNEGPTGMRYRSMGGECFDLRAKTSATDPEAIGSGTWVLDASRTLVVRKTATKDLYSLHFNGEEVGALKGGDPRWITVKFAKVPPDSRTTIGHGYSLRNDPPGPFQ